MFEEPRQIVLRAEEIRKSFREGSHALEVLGGVTLDVRRGELTLLMGPSGSGKTTLLMIMGLLLKPTAGRINLMGTDVTDLGERAPWCPSCVERRYDYAATAAHASSVLCGRDAVQISVRRETQVSLPPLADRLRSVGQVAFNDYMLRLRVDGYELNVFPD